MTRRIHFLVCIGLGALLPAACGVLGDQQSQALPATTSGNFDAESKAAARALSIGNTAAIEAVDDPYQLAVLCRVALEGLMGPLRSSGGLSAAQIDALERIAAVYGERTRELARARGEGLQKIAADLARQREEQTDPAEQGRAAMGCIQRLQ